MIKRNKKYFENFSELAEEMFEASLDCSMSTCFIGDYDDTSELLGVLLSDYRNIISIMEIDIADIEMSGYDGPYLLTITEYGELFCQKAYWEEGDSLYHFEDDLCFVTPEYYDDAVEACYNEEVDFFEVYFGAVDEESESSDAEFHLIKDQDGRVSGFTYDNEDEGSCVHIHCCSCTPRDIGNVIDIYNIMTNALEKWFI